jgi:hypothetical protein
VLLTLATQGVRVHQETARLAATVSSQAADLTSERLAVAVLHRRLAALEDNAGGTTAAGSTTAAAADTPAPGGTSDGHVASEGGRRLASGAAWADFSGLSSTPPVPSAWELALNIDTSDGHNVNYANYLFW